MVIRSAGQTGGTENILTAWSGVPSTVPELERYCGTIPISAAISASTIRSRNNGFTVVHVAFGPEIRENLLVNGFPGHARAKTSGYSSSDSTVATVNNMGVITRKSSGDGKDHCSMRRVKRSLHSLRLQVRKHRNDIRRYGEAVSFRGGGSSGGGGGGGRSGGGGHAMTGSASANAGSQKPAALK